MSSPDDRDFARYRANGDAAALAAVFDRTAPKLLLLASHWTRDPATAEDLVQVTFVQALRDAAQWDEAQPLLGWLSGILAHRALDLRKHAARRSHEPFPDQEPAGREADPLAVAMDQEVLQRVTAAVDAMQEPYRDVLVLRLVHGLEPVAIAHALGRAPATVRKQLERGLQQLRSALPATIAVLLAGMLTAGRGLAAVREAVLSAGRPAMPVAVTTIGGVLLMKKTLVATFAGALALTALLFWSLHGTPGQAPPGAPAPASPIQVTANAPVAVEAAAERAPVPADVDAVDPGTAALEVAVLDEGGGAAVSGAVVGLWPRNGRDEDLQTRCQPTDAAGIAVFEHLVAGPYHASLDLGGDLDTDVAAAQRRRVELRLRGVVAVHGVVVDANGQPVPGATVLRRKDPQRSGPLDSGKPVAVADASGQFQVTGVSGSLGLQAQDARHAPSPVQYVRSKEIREPVVLQLGEQPARLAGTLSGAGVSEAIVELERPRASPRRTKNGSSYEHANSLVRCDPEGRFAMEGLLPGKATLHVRARGSAPKDVEIVLTAGATSELAIELEATAALHGHVLDQDGAPLAGVKVGCRPDRTRTSATGEFLLDCLAPGKIDVWVGPLEGYCARKLELEVQAAQPAECEVRLERLPVLAGRVVDAGGRGVAGLSVTAIRTDLGRGTYQPMTDDHGRMDMQYGRAAVTGTDGSFRLPLMPEVAYLLDVSEPGQWLKIHGERFGTFTAPRSDVVLALQPEDLATAWIEGRVLDGNGGPMARAWFQVSDGKFIGTIGENTPGSRHPDVAGRFRIGPLPARSYVLRVHPEDAAIPEFETPRFQLVPDQKLDLGDLTAGAFGTLSVRLRRREGGLFAEALLQLDSKDKPTAIFDFDRKGNVQQSVKPGTYQMTVYGGPFPWQKESFTVGAGERKEFEFALPAASWFRVRLVPPGLMKGSVVVRGPDGTVEFTDEAENAPSSACLTPGAHTAEFTDAGGGRHTASFLVATQPSEPGKPPAPCELQWVRVK